MRGGSHSSDADDRWKSLMAVAKELRLDVPRELTVTLASRETTPELGFSPTRELLSRDVFFSALVCYNDLAAIGAIRVIREHGLRVPEDISVVGFDDIESASFNSPSITTIRQPLQQMGSMAAHILLKRIRGLETIANITPVLPELVVRESTSPLNLGRTRWKRD